MQAVPSRQEPVVQTSESRQARCPTRGIVLASLAWCGVILFTMPLKQVSSFFLISHHLRNYGLRHHDRDAAFAQGQNASVDCGMHTAWTCSNCVSAFKPSLRATHCRGDCAWSGGKCLPGNTKVSAHSWMTADEKSHLSLLSRIQEGGGGGADFSTFIPWARPGSPDNMAKISNDELDTVAILVMSGRNDHERRKTIRDTWGKHHKNVYFMVGAHGCSIPKEHRVSWTCFLKSIPPASVQAFHDAEEVIVDARLQDEVSKYHDIILLPMVDTYRALPRKLKESYRWAVQQTNAKWMLKIGE